MIKACHTCKWWSFYATPEHAYSEVTVDAAVLELSCAHKHYDLPKDGGDYLDTDDCREALAKGTFCLDWEPVAITKHNRGAGYLPCPWFDDWTVEYNKQCREHWHNKIGEAI